MGENQKASVFEEGFPDTLVLEERAKIALNALCGCVDEKHDYIPYMAVNLLANPALMTHSPWDYGSSTGRLVDAIALARVMCDIDEPLEVERRLRKNLLSFFKEDGLSYRRPSPVNEPNANLHDQRAVLLGLTTWYMLSEDSLVKEHADRLCSALKKIAIKEKDYWCFPAVEYTERGWPSKDAIYVGTMIDAAHTNARMINPLIKYYALTGNRDAFELAEKFVRHFVHYSGAINPDGSFNKGTEFRKGHFHSRTVSVAGVAKFAHFTGNASLMGWVKKVYDWILTKGTAFGWFPGGLVKNQVYHHETCSLTDIIEIGILLARAGYWEHWEDVERFVRNHLVGTQLLSGEGFSEAETLDEDDWKITRYRVVSRSIGAFPGWAAPNDFVNETDHSWDIMTCCNCHGVRGLFLAWSNAVTKEHNCFSVNLLFNRRTPWLDVKSYLPFEGKVVVKARQNLEELRLRIPSWVPFEKVQITRKKGVNGETRRADDWVSPFVRIFGLEEGEIVEIAFPVREQKSTEVAWDREFTVQWRGDNVISIEPQGKYYPLYKGFDELEKVPLKKEALLCERVVEW